MAEGEWHSQWLSIAINGFCWSIPLCTLQMSYTLVSREGNYFLLHLGDAVRALMNFDLGLDHQGSKENEQ